MTSETTTKAALRGIYGESDGQCIINENMKKYVTHSSNYQRFYPAKSFAVEKNRQREHMSAPMFYYDLNLN